MRTFLLAILLSAPCIPAMAALADAPTDFGNASHPTRGRKLASTHAGNVYHVSETQLESGTLIREYVTLEGKVFAVSWSGPFIPDLRTLLGKHFDTLTAETSKSPKGGHSQVNVIRPDVIITAGGHMRAFSGRAWVVADIPVGFKVDDIN